MSASNEVVRVPAVDILLMYGCVTSDYLYHRSIPMKKKEQKKMLLIVMNIFFWENRKSFYYYYCCF